MMLAMVMGVVVGCCNQVLLLGVVAARWRQDREAGRVRVEWRGGECMYVPVNIGAEFWFLRMNKAFWCLIVEQDQSSQGPKKKKKKKKERTGLTLFIFFPSTHDACA
jgi:hypothetical protein